LTPCSKEVLMNETDDCLFIKGIRGKLQY